MVVFISTTITLTSGTGPTAADITSNQCLIATREWFNQYRRYYRWHCSVRISVDGGGYSGTVNSYNLSAGNHTVNVRDANGCIFSTTIVITSGTGPTNINVTTTPADCGANNGTITIGTVTDGEAPYTFSVDGWSIQR